MIVDLRSDVLTRPTPRMLDAMTSASMGDDVFDEDPTVHILQEKVARLTGREAALFVVSGTMANQLAIAAQTQPHDEIILDIKSHIFQFEQGAPATISGVQTRPLPFDMGIPSEEMIEDSIKFPNVHHTRSRLLCLEITHNYHGGLIPDINKVKTVCKKARELGLKVHIDGARIWNAVVATGTPITEYASLCDTMMFCFSKGLGAPIGSVLAGPKEVIERALYLRKGLGGGWRQPGILAAAALHALDNHIDRLAEDHKHAQQIAEAVRNNLNLELIGRVDTNMVFFRPKDGNLEACSKRLTEMGILHGWKHFKKFRLVTYLGITDEMIEYTIDRLANRGI